MPSRARTRSVDEEAGRIAARPYARMLIPDVEDGGYVARVLEFPGCVSEGDTPNEAIANIEDALRLVVESMLVRGDAIPEPLSSREYSGRLNLRIPPTLHARATEHAALEGVSLNRLLSDAIAQRLGVAAPAVLRVADVEAEKIAAEATIVR